VNVLAALEKSLPNVYIPRDTLIAKFEIDLLKVFKIKDPAPSKFNSNVVPVIVILLPKI